MALISYAQAVERFDPLLLPALSGAVGFEPLWIELGDRRYPIHFGPWQPRHLARRSHWW